MISWRKKFNTSHKEFAYRVHFLCAVDLLADSPLGLFENVCFQDSCGAQNSWRGEAPNELSPKTNISNKSTGERLSEYCEGLECLFLKLLHLNGNKTWNCLQF